MKRAPSRSTNGAGALRIFMAICGVIIAIGGALQVWKGVKTMRGGSNSEFTALLEASDKAAGEGKQHAEEAQPRFQQMMNEIDKVGLPQFRAEQRATATSVSETFGKSVEQFVLAGKKLEDSKALNTNERLKPFLDTKAKSYNLLAQTLRVNQEMIGMVLDDSIQTVDALLPKLNAAAARREAIDKEATAAGNEATEFAKQIKGDASK